MRKKFIIIMMPVIVILITYLSVFFALKREVRTKQAETPVLKQDAVVNIIDLSGRFEG